MKKPVAKVVSLAAKKHARMTLEAFDKMERDAKRAEQENRAEVERKSRNTL